MKCCIFGSGSSGNMTYIESQQTKIILDCGLSPKRCNAIAKEKDIDLTTVEAIFITHEHTDHTKYLDKILSLSKAKLFITKESFNALRDEIKENLTNAEVIFIEPDKKYTFKDMIIYTLLLSHDASCCIGYIFESESNRIFYASDTGVMPTKYINLLRVCDIILIESNHNIDMAINSSRPIDVTRRTLSSTGHLSNDVAYAILDKVLSDYNKYVVLVHVSCECNCDECINDEVINRLKTKYNGSIIIARQTEPTPMLEV